jgi:DNA-damage-inducible protein D
MEESNLIPFEGREIRKVWHNEEWYFSVVDVIEFLTGSPNPNVYWSAMKKREKQVFTFCKKVKLQGLDGKNYPSDCANTEGVLRIVMSVPSPKAEPLKMWLAEQGARTIEETENPELAFDRAKELYKAKGYTDEWITRRMQTIETRKELTDEWKKRGVKEGTEYSILTATIAKGTFGMTPTEHKDMKGLKNENLRDHMTPLELIFTALGEELTKQTAITDDVQGFNENHEAATKGGDLAGKYRKDTEKRGFKVISKDNFLPPLKDDKELPPSE